MTVSAVIPIRFADCCDVDGRPLFQLSGRTLWDITLEQACGSEALDNVIVAYDDPRFLDLIGDWREQVVLCERPMRLSAADAIILDVLSFVAYEGQSASFASDHYVLVEITHPLRPVGIIDQMVDAIGSLDADSLITCRRSHYSLWRRDGFGTTTRIQGPYGEEKAELYQELTGICSVFSASSLIAGEGFGEKVDIVPIDKYWATIDVRDVDGLWLAEQYLERLGIDI